VYSAGLIAMPARTAAAGARKMPSGLSYFEAGDDCGHEAAMPNEEARVIVTPALASAKIGRIA